MKSDIVGRKAKRSGKEFVEDLELELEKEAKVCSVRVVATVKFSPYFVFQALYSHHGIVASRRSLLKGVEGLFCWKDSPNFTPSKLILASSRWKN